MKVRVSYLLDLSDVSQAQQAEDVAPLVTKLLWSPARKAHKEAIEAIRLDGRLSSPDKDEAILPHVRGIMLALMGENNTSVELLDPATEVELRLPFERFLTPAND